MGNLHISNMNLLQLVWNAWYHQTHNHKQQKEELAFITNTTMQCPVGML